MSTTELIIRLISGVVLLMLNAFFVVTEFSLTRLRQFGEVGRSEHPGLKRAWQMTEKLEIYLTGCQLGITSTSVLMGVVAEPAVTETLKPLLSLLQVPESAMPGVSVTVAIVIINLLHKIWGEQAPTYLGVERPVQVAKFTGRIHFWWCTIMKPIIYLGDGLAKGTLRLFGVEISRSWLEAEEGEGDDQSSDSGERQVRPGSYSDLRREMGDILTRGGLSHDRKKEVIRALEIDRIPVKDIMVPREEIRGISINAPVEENLRIMSDRRRFMRFPLVKENSLDETVGFVYLAEVFRNLKKLKSGEVSLEEIATDPLHVPEDLPVSEFIDRLQDARQELALIEKDGKVTGMATVTEALEAIAGDLQDPFDDEENEKKAA